MRRSVASLILIVSLLGCACILTVCVLLFPAKGILPIPPAEELEGTWIAFASGRDGKPELYKMRPDGSQVTRLTDNLALVTMPSWSPDGNWIVFESERYDAESEHYGHYGNKEIYKVRIDGSQVSRLTDHPAWDADPSWSPDGNWIAFVSDRDGNDKIYKMRADGAEVTRLTDGSGDDWRPCWSPDGDSIAFHSDRYGNFEILKMRADGSHVTSLTYDPAWDTEPSWSPDGNWIAFERKNAIYKVSADGNQVIKLTNDTAVPAVNEDYSWSPDGNWIAFVRTSRGNSEIYKMRTDGSDLTRLTNDPAFDEDPSWSPDGNWIVFVSRRDGNLEIYKMKADGNQVTRLTHNPANLITALRHFLSGWGEGPDDNQPAWGP